MSNAETCSQKFLCSTGYTRGLVFRNFKLAISRLRRTCKPMYSRPSWAGCTEIGVLRSSESGSPRTSGPAWKMRIRLCARHISWSLRPKFLARQRNPQLVILLYPHPHCRKTQSVLCRVVPETTPASRAAAYNRKPIDPSKNQDMRVAASTLVPRRPTSLAAGTGVDQPADAGMQMVHSHDDARQLVQIRPGVQERGRGPGMWTTHDSCLWHHPVCGFRLGFSVLSTAQEAQGENSVRRCAKKGRRQAR